MRWGGRYSPTHCGYPVGPAREGSAIPSGVQPPPPPSSSGRAPGSRISVRGEGQGPANQTQTAGGRRCGVGGRREGTRVRCWVPVGSPGRVIAGLGHVRNPLLVAWPAAEAGGASRCEPGALVVVQQQTHQGVVHKEGLRPPPLPPPRYTQLLPLPSAPRARNCLCSRRSDL